MVAFLLLALLLSFSPPSCSATVVDAATNRPLASVSVRAGEPGAGATSTDVRGHFSLASTSRTLDFSLLGYALLHVAVPAASEVPDTLRLLPRSYTLAEVSVRSPRSYVLTAFPAGGRSWAACSTPARPWPCPSPAG